jgi:peptidoglycan L-alanyl-D-glutamate endopeptidase CwlK
MQSPEIANIERVLMSFGYDGIEPDGFFDEKTENVVRNIQKTHGLTIDGIIGEKTLALLDFLFEPSKPNFSSSNFIPPEQVPSVRTSDAINRTNLNGVHPVLVRKTAQLIELAKNEGYVLRVSQGFRSFAEQDKLFAKRPKVTNARGGQSMHNYGLAVDFVFIVNGKVSWDERFYKNIGRWANQVGLTWGGNWKFVDMPHCQLTNLPSFRYLLETYRAAGGGDRGIVAVWKKYVG